MRLQRITKKREEMFLTVGEESKTDSGANAVASFLNLFNRLQLIEDILGDEYDLNRLRELIYIDLERERWLQAAENGIEKPVMRYALESDGWGFRKLLKENNTTAERVVELVQADRDGRIIFFPFVAMVEQSLTDGEMKPQRDQRFNGRYAVVYNDPKKWGCPLIDICGKAYNSGEANERKNALTREQAEAALNEMKEAESE